MASRARPDGRAAGQRRLQVGLIGANIKRSLSPALHEKEGALQGLGYDYRLFDLDDEPEGLDALPDVLRRMEASGFAGTNVTHPVKQAVMPLLDRLSPDAAALGAVNTVRFAADGRREGHNTDWWGFGENLRRGLGVAAPGRVVLLGAGGAGSAAAYALGRMDASEIVVVDVDPRRAADVAGRMAGLGFAAVARPHTALAEAIAGSDGLVHATPVGMVGHPGLPVDPAWLRPPLWIAEIVYVPMETELLRAARAAGCRTVDGGGMVVLQAAGAFEVFSGVPADAQRMMAHFTELVG